MSGDSPLGAGYLYHSRLRSQLVITLKIFFSSKAYAEPAGYIDYYGTVYLTRENKVRVGDIVVYGLRNQVFVSGKRSGCQWHSIR